MAIESNMLRHTRDGRITNFPVEGKYPHEGWALVRAWIGERKDEPNLSHIPEKDRELLRQRVRYLLHEWVAKLHKDIGSEIFKQDLADQYGYDSFEELEAASKQ